MRLRPGLVLLICCGTGLAACTAGPPKGPVTSVTTPRVGRPQPPSSAQAALSHEAFTPYAALGLSNDDGLAPNESQFALAGACMAAAGFPNVSDTAVPFGIRFGVLAGLSFTQPWGAWGYLDPAAAQQYGFLVPPGAALTALGVSGTPQDPSSLPPAEQAAALKCSTIVQNFSNATQAGALAEIGTLANDISNDVLRHPAVKAATRAWAACMAKNGFSFGQPQGVFFQEMHTIYPGQSGRGIQISGSAQPSASANRAQLAVAVTDASCTQATDLDGIYFAVQSNYEQQLVNANQQALTAAVRRYRAAYARELATLQRLLRTTKTVAFRPGKRLRPGARPTG